LIFTLEHLGGSVDPGFRLNPHGRYAHTDAYVVGTVSGAGLVVRSATHGDLRRECGKAVDGLVVVANAAAPDRALREPVSG